jgi:tryptophan-rich sensory protein
MTVLASRGQLRASFLRWALVIVPAVLLAGFLSAQVAGSAAEGQ